MNAPNESRLFCLDILRGLDMFYLAVISVILRPFFVAIGAGPAWGNFFITHPWYGFTLYDIIMPLFIFMSGAAIPFALKKRLNNEGKPGEGYWRHVWSRVALLWILGMLTQGNLTTLNIHKLGFYNNTLQTIAIGYLVAAWVYPMKKWSVKIAIPIVLTILYGALIHFGGDYTKDGNISQHIDLAVWGSIMPADSAFVAQIAKNGYSWLLPSLMFPVIALAGCYSTQILRAKRIDDWCKVQWLGLFGGASLALGWILYFCGVDMVKHIFTVSFTLQAIGWSILALDVLFVVTDIWRFRKGTGLILLFGQFALAAYLCEAAFRCVCNRASERLFADLAGYCPKAWGNVVLAIGSSIVLTAAIWVWRGYKLSKKVK